jgi:hypothetical protein
MSKKYAASCVLLEPLNENLSPFFAAASAPSSNAIFSSRSAPHWENAADGDLIWQTSAADEPPLMAAENAFWATGTGTFTSHAWVNGRCPWTCGQDR